MLVNEKPLYIKNAMIYTEEGKITGSLLVGNGQIKDIQTENIAVPEQADLIDGTGLNVIPGFIDSHIHGAAGADTMDATEEALDLIAAELPKEGSTSFLATTITQAREEIEVALKN